MRHFGKNPTRKRSAAAMRAPACPILGPILPSEHHSCARCARSPPRPATSISGRKTVPSFDLRGVWEKKTAVPRHCRQVAARQPQMSFQQRFPSTPPAYRRRGSPGDALRPNAPVGMFSERFQSDFPRQPTPRAASAASPSPTARHPKSPCACPSSSAHGRASSPSGCRRRS